MFSQLVKIRFSFEKKSVCKFLFWQKWKFDETRRQIQKIGAASNTDKPVLLSSSSYVGLYICIAYIFGQHSRSTMENRWNE